MKRSEINNLIHQAIKLLDAYQIMLPPFAFWSPDDWMAKGTECDEIRICKLGWDITDFGSGAFDEVGLVVFTVRNGHHEIEPYRSKRYAEKLLIVGEGQRTPMHHHRLKSEDIIVRGGGNLVIRLYNKAPDGGLAEGDVDVSLDGVRHRVKAGELLRLSPGRSITLTPFLYHEFWAEPGRGVAVVQEVSSVNDDLIDNSFLDAVGRFPAIEEDVPAIHPLCWEYPDARQAC